MRLILLQALGATLLLATGGCGITNGSADTETVEGMATPIKMVLGGAGASFPAPLFQRWFEELANQGVRVKYLSVGSGVGIQQFLYNSVDFAASDVPIQAKDIATVPQGVVQIPMTAGAIAIAYNNPGCELKLSQAQLVGLFTGAISNYGQLGCAPKPIKVVVRSDGSGSTANITAHLAAIDGSWRQKVGTGKLVNWPVGAKAKGTEGMAKELKEADGALGYVDLSHVRAPLQSAALTNGSGLVVKPTPGSMGEALAATDVGPDLVGRNPNPQKGYPLVAMSWILLKKSGNGPTNQAAFTKVFSYALSAPAQAMAPELGFISLAPALLEKSRAALVTLQP
ncbi:MAG: phosphate ABC transporter substrate-binding protein PstS [Cyanobium sp.]